MTEEGEGSTRLEFFAQQFVMVSVAGNENDGLDVRLCWVGAPAGVSARS